MTGITGWTANWGTGITGPIHPDPVGRQDLRRSGQFTRFGIPAIIILCRLQPYDAGDLYDSLGAYNSSFVGEILKELSFRQRVFDKDPDNKTNIDYYTSASGGCPMPVTVSVF